MKKFVKIFTLGLVILLVTFLFFLAYVYYSNEIYKVKCPAYSGEYFKWFPYSEGDTLYFLNNNSESAFTVSFYKANHRNQYDSRYKCGCCEEGVTMILSGKSDTLNIDFQNFNNDKSCFGTSIEINEEMVYDNSKLVVDSAYNNNKAEFLLLNNKYFIAKNYGLVQFSLNDTIWKLDRITKSGKPTEILIKNCN